LSKIRGTIRWWAARPYRTHGKLRRIAWSWGTREAQRERARSRMTVLKIASERCVGADEICVKGVRGCFPDKRFISSCFGRGL